jgi:hypothetical protein
MCKFGGHLMFNEKATIIQSSRIPTSQAMKLIATEAAIN